MTGQQLVWEDYITIAAYFVLVIGVGIWSTCRPNKGTAIGYFLAGKDMHWLPVGASIYASNVGAPIFIGLAGTAAASGFAVSIYEWHAAFILISLGWFFVPVYIASGAYTMPEYLGKRLGGKRIRLCASVMSLILFVTGNISAEIYSGTIFMDQVLGWNMYLSVFVIVIITAIYTITGGLQSVIYTDTLQTFILLGGAIVLTVKSMSDVGGWAGLLDKYPWAAANYTLENQTFYQCGMPREDAFHMWRDPVKGDIPWPGALFGLTLLGIYAWCNDQILVQRCLSARSLSHAKAGSLLAGFLKLTSFFLFIIPGMISRILYPEEIACASPEACDHYCGNEAGCSNLAYPLLVIRGLPIGVRGLMLAALMAALMSSLTSIFNSASSIATLDLWTRFRPRAKEAELMIVGRVTIVVLLGVSILWLPILKQAQGGLMWFYLQSIRAYLVVPWCMLFIIGLLWKRLTEKGAFWGLVIGICVGVTRMVMDFAITAPFCGSGDPDNRLEVVAKVDFLHFAIILAVISTVAIVVISLFTEPRRPDQLRRVTWWTRHDEEEPELTDDEEEDNYELKNDPEKAKEMTLQVPKTRPSGCAAFWKAWLCGTDDRKQTLSAAERAEIRKRLTSIQQDQRSSIILNILAVLLAIFTTFWLGYFA